MLSTFDTTPIRIPQLSRLPAINTIIPSPCQAALRTSEPQNRARWHRQKLTMPNNTSPTKIWVIPIPFSNQAKQRNGASNAM